MSWLIIKEKGQPARAFPLAHKRYTVGRGERADLILPNVSVSRAHFRLIRRHDRVVLEDLGSQNGTRVNEQPIDFHDLATGDTIEAGKYALVFIGDDLRPAMYGNDLVEDMPGYTFVKRKAVDATHTMSAALLNKLRQLRDVSERGGVMDADDPDERWLIGDDIVRFGGKGRVPVRATFARGVVAEIYWDESHHLLRRRSRLVKVEVNGEGVSERPLRVGDKLRIGNSIFRYGLLE